MSLSRDIETIRRALEEVSLDPEEVRAWSRIVEHFTHCLAADTPEEETP